MSKEKFREILEGAVAGKNEDIEKILEIYMPLIDKMSYIDGELDEDLRQILIIHITRQISKFRFE